VCDRGPSMIVDSGAGNDSRPSELGKRSTPPPEDDRPDPGHGRSRMSAWSLEMMRSPAMFRPGSGTSARRPVAEHDVCRFRRLACATTVFAR